MVRIVSEASLRKKSERELRKRLTRLRKEFKQNLKTIPKETPAKARERQRRLTAIDKEIKKTRRAIAYKKSMR